jgi:hypothetical protein
VKKLNMISRNSGNCYGTSILTTSGTVITDIKRRKDVGHKKRVLQDL